MNKKEYILCAAVVYNDKKPNTQDVKGFKNGIMFTGFRHSDCHKLAKITSSRNHCDLKTVEGFLTSKNRFVNRKQAMKIALKSGQILVGFITTDELRSEDLY